MRLGQLRPYQFPTAIAQFKKGLAFKNATLNTKIDLFNFLGNSSLALNQRLEAKTAFHSVFLLEGAPDEIKSIFRRSKS